MNRKRLLETDLLLEPPATIKIQIPHGAYLLEMGSEDVADALAQLRDYFKANIVCLFSGGGEVSLVNVSALDSIIANLAFASKIKGTSVRCDRELARKAQEHRLDHLDDVKFVSQILDYSLDARFLIQNAAPAGFRPLKYTCFGFLLVKPTGPALLLSVYKPFHPANLYSLVYGDGVDQTVWLVERGKRI